VILLLVTISRSCFGGCGFSFAGAMAAHLIRGLEAENPPKLLAALREILNGNL